MASKVRQGSISKVSQREISRRLGFSLSTVTESIRQLKEAGKVTESPKRTPRETTTYFLKSNVFGSKQRDGITEIISSPSGSRMVSVGPEQLRA